MAKCRFNKYAPCTGTGVCEVCKVPNKYGWFSEHKKMKWTWGTQQFILPKERRERIKFQELIIEKAQEEIRKIKSIPEKEKKR